MVSPRLSIGLIGNCRFEHGGHEVTFKSAKARALLAMIALSEGCSISREAARGLLWSEAEEARAKTSLRNVIWQINATFADYGFNGFSAGWAELSFETGAVALDVDAVMKTLRDNETPEAIVSDPWCLEKVAEGCDALSPGFDEWLGQIRSQLQREMHRRICGRAASGDDKVALIALDLEPTNEAAAQTAISSFAAKGQPANALTVYQALWHALDEAFGEEPSEATQAMIVALKQKEAAISETAQEHRPLITVDALLDSADGSAARLSALRADLLSHLVRFREWRIVDGAYEDGAPVEGFRLSLAGVGEAETFAILLTLREARGNVLVWSEKLDAPFLQLGSGRDEPIRRIALALNVHLTASRLVASPGEPSPSLSHYDDWLRAEALMKTFKPENWDTAARQLDQLIDQAPAFSRAYANRAGTYTTRQLAFPGHAVPMTDLRRALSLARKAVELDPMDSRSQLALGWSAAMLRQFDHAALAYELAYQHNSADPWTLLSAAVGLAFCDRREFAWSLSEAAIDLLPAPSAPHWSYHAATAFLAGRLEACVAASEKADRISPDVPAWHAAALAALSREGEARFVGQDLLDGARQAWVGGDVCNETSVARWVLSCFPIRSSESWELLRNGLATIGFDPKFSRAEASSHQRPGLTPGAPT